jgi:hypothetical protein
MQALTLLISQNFKAERYEREWPGLSQIEKAQRRHWKMSRACPAFRLQQYRAV